ncbi:MAG: hypothetical protein JW839_06690, partial [Candidatus Lokiarchaeota archaeon]|nr:hypothetical protein [Candidatus Lokiarchaeota archaeon]
ITSLAVTSPRPAPGPYVGGEVLTLRVTFGNTGGTSASVDASLDDGAYTGVTFGNPAAVTVAAGSTTTQDHLITISTGATTAAVTLTVTWTGTEQLSGRVISGGSSSIAIHIQARAIVSITASAITSPRAAPGPYAAGENLTLTVTFTNTGGTAATVGATLAFGGYTKISHRSSPAVVVGACGQGTQEFTIVVDADATNELVTIVVGWNGTEASTGRPMSNDTKSIVSLWIETMCTESPGNPLQLAMTTLAFSFAAALAVVGITVAKRGKKPKRDWIEA